MKRSNGFSLIELMVTLGIASIVLTAGVPSFRSVIMDNRMATQANKFVTAVAMARSAAVKYQTDATICSSTNFDAALPACNGTSDWSTGWIVWVDKDRDGAKTADEVISVSEPLSTASTFVSEAVASIEYDARGFSTAIDGDTFTLCDSRTGETGREIKVNPVGRTNVARQACDVPDPTPDPCPDPCTM